MRTNTACNRYQAARGRLYYLSAAFIQEQPLIETYTVHPCTYTWLLPWYNSHGFIKQFDKLDASKVVYIYCHNVG